MVEQLVSQMVGNVDTNVINEAVSKVANTVIDKDGCIEDITKIDLKKQLLVDNAQDREGYLDIKKRTPARLGIGRVGTRYKTISALRFRADHAAAQDSVFSYVSEDFIKKNGLLPLETLCGNKDVYITRPDLGRRFSEETFNLIGEKVGKNHQVVIMVGDGLSSAAVEANIEDIVPAIKQGFKMYGIKCADEIPFVKHCRVGAMDHLGDATNAEVVVLLVGERPGLVTAKSMSAYIAYRPTVGMPEAKRTVISNIHAGGTTAVEAGAHIAELVKTMLEKKASGIDLK